MLTNAEGKGSKDERRAAKEAARKLKLSYYTVYSFPKSGRTWLSHLWYNYTVFATGLQPPPPERFRDVKVPTDSRWYHEVIVPKYFEQGLSTLRFTHDVSPGDRLADLEESLGEALSTRRYALILRRPAKVIESYFHHSSNRLKDKGYLQENGVTDLSKFVHDERYGIDRLIDYTTVFDRHRGEHQRAVFYEDMLAGSGAVLRSLLEHAGHARIDSDALEQAAASSSFVQMQSREGEARKELKGREPEFNQMRSRVGGDGPGELSAEDRAFIQRKLDAAPAGALRAIPRAGSGTPGAGPVPG